MDIFTRFLGIKGKKEYIIDHFFNQIDIAAQFQIQAYYNFLKKEKIDLEMVFKWFFKEYLYSEFNVRGFFFNPSMANATYLEKTEI